MKNLHNKLASMPGTEVADPIDNSVTEHQGIRIYDTSGARTEGATLRVYLESYEADPARHDQELQQTLAPVIEAVDAVAEIKVRTGREGPAMVS